MRARTRLRADIYRCVYAHVRQSVGHVIVEADYTA